MSRRIPLKVYTGPQTQPAPNFPPPNNFGPRQMPPPPPMKYYGPPPPMYMGRDLDPYYSSESSFDEDEDGDSFCETYRGCIIGILIILIIAAVTVAVIIYIKDIKNFMGGVFGGGKNDADSSNKKDGGKKSKKSGSRGGGKRSGGKGDDGERDDGEGGDEKGGDGKGDGDNGDSEKGGKEDGGEGDAGKADTGKKDSGKADAEKKDSGKTDAGKKDSGKADAGKKDSGKADAGKKDSGKADAGKKDSGKADAVKKAAFRADAEKKDAVKKDAGKKDAGKKDSGKKDAGKAGGGKKLDYNSVTDIDPTELNNDAEYQKWIMTTHNEYRAKHKAKALVWDKQMTKQAFQCAKYYMNIGQIDHSCPTKKVDPSVDKNSDYEKYGENLYLANKVKGSVQFYAERAMHGWYKEVEDYDFNTCQAKKPKQKVGHFTQIVWKDSHKLGVAEIKQGETVIVVCLYQPTGNVKGDYQDNVIPA